MARRGKQAKRKGLAERRARRNLNQGLARRIGRALLYSGLASIAALMIVAAFILITRIAFSADGSGTNSVSPGTATAGATGNTQTFTFTASETMDSGEISITVPSGWSAPQGSSGTAGYTTATSSAGTVANVEDNADAITGWAAGNACSSGLSLDSSVKQEGGSALKCANGNEGGGNRWYRNITAENWSGYTKVAFWIRSSGTISDTNLRFGYDNSANMASPLEQISFGQAIPANTWTYVVLNFGNTSRSSVVSFGFVIRNATDLDNKTVWIDDLLIGPGAPSFPGGNDVRVRLLKLGGGQTAVVTYGSGGGTSGATVPTTAGTYSFLTKSRISAAGTLSNITSSPGVTVNAGPVTQFSLTDPGNTSAGARLGYTVTRKDQFGNAATSGSTTVYLYSTSVGANKRFYDAASGGNIVTSVTIGVGQSSANFWYYDEAPGSYTITASDNASAPDGATGVSDATDAVTVSAGATAQFLLTDASGFTAGERAAYSVTRKDAFGNLVTSGSVIVYLYSNSGSPSRAFYDAASGGSQITSVSIGSGTSSANFWYYDERAGSWTVTASDNASAPDGATGVSDATDGITVSPAAVAQFALNDPGNMTAGTRLGYTVTRKDQFGNAVTSGSTTVYLYSTSVGANKRFYDAASGGNIVTSVTIVGGQSTANFWYYDELAGTFSITASDNSSAPDGTSGLDDASDSVTVSPAAVSRFALNDPGNMTAGTRLGYTVTRKDAFGNLVTSGSTTAYLYSNSVGANKAFYNAASGGSQITSVSIGSSQSTANFWYFDDAPGAYTVTVSDNATSPDGASGIADATDSVTVNAAPIVATRFTILDPADGTVDASIQVTVRAEDNSGNVDTTYQSDVTLVASGAATGGGLVNIVNGVGTLNVSDTVAQTVNLSLSDSQGTGLNVASTQNVVFAPGAVSQFTLNDPGNMTAGTRLGYTVTRKDQFGNAVSAGASTVYLYSSATGTKAFYDAEAGGNQITAVTVLSGQSNAAFWYYDELAGSPTVTVSDNVVSPDGATGISDATDGVTVSPAAVSKFTLNDPGDMTAGTRLGYTVRRRDTFNNPVTSGSATVYLYSSSAGVNKAFYSAASGGSSVASRLIASGQSSADFWYFDDATGTFTITASDNPSSPDGAGGVIDAADTVIVSAAPIVAARFVILNPTDTGVGNNVVVTVRAEDNNGNLDTTYQNDVTLVSSGSATGGGLVDIVNGVGTLTITDNAAETVLLTLSDTAGTGLNVSSVQDVVFQGAGGGSSGRGREEPAAPTAAGAPEAPTLSRAAITLTFSGRALPNAKITLIGRTASQDIPIKIGAAESDGSFELKFEGALPAAGIKSYRLSFEDREGRLSETFDLSPESPTAGGVFRDIFAPPTLGLGKSTVLRGDFIVLAGFALPGAKIDVEIDGRQVSQDVYAGNDGSFKLLIADFDYAFGSHKVKARQRDQALAVSGYSAERVFVAAKVFAPKADLNDDGKVNVSDWSIFLFRWGSKDETKKATIDFNNNGQADISDFSIFLQSLIGVRQ